MDARRYEKTTPRSIAGSMRSSVSTRRCARSFSPYIRSLRTRRSPCRTRCSAARYASAPKRRSRYRWTSGSAISSPSGGSSAKKRCDRLLDIAAELQKRGFAFRWYFAGSGPLFEDIRRRRDALGLGPCVTLTGYMENPCSLLARCNALVLFSEYEGTPVTIDEAKTLGVPVIANDVGGVREMLEDGRYGKIASDDNGFIKLITQL